MNRGYLCKDKAGRISKVLELIVSNLPVRYYTREFLHSIFVLFDLISDEVMEFDLMRNLSTCLIGIDQIQRRAEEFEASIKMFYHIDQSVTEGRENRIMKTEYLEKEVYSTQFYGLMYKSLACQANYFKVGVTLHLYPEMIDLRFLYKYLKRSRSFEKDLFIPMMQAFYDFIQRRLETKDTEDPRKLYYLLKLVKASVPYVLLFKRKDTRRTVKRLFATLPKIEEMQVTFSFEHFIDYFNRKKNLKRSSKLWLTYFELLSIFLCFDLSDEWDTKKEKYKYLIYSFQLIHLKGIPWREKVDELQHSNLGNIYKSLFIFLLVKTYGLSLRDQEKIGSNPDGEYITKHLSGYLEEYLVHFGNDTSHLYLLSLKGGTYGSDLMESTDDINHLVLFFILSISTENNELIQRFNKKIMSYSPNALEKSIGALMVKKSIVSCYWAFEYDYGQYLYESRAISLFDDDVLEGWATKTTVNWGWVSPFKFVISCISGSLHMFPVSVRMIAYSYNLYIDYFPWHESSSAGKIEEIVRLCIITVEKGEMHAIEEVDGCLKLLNFIAGHVVPRDASLRNVISDIRLYLKNKGLRFPVGDFRWKIAGALISKDLRMEVKMAANTGSLCHLIKIFGFLARFPLKDYAFNVIASIFGQNQSDLSTIYMDNEIFLLNAVEIPHHLFYRRKDEYVIKKREFVPHVKLAI
jgi:hypothetical protein